MFVTFIGPPISGKTTAAAGLFASLKDNGFSVEFLAEHARMYIASKKRIEGEEFNGLDDIDQNLIMLGQEHREEVMNDPSSILVSDSSAVLALLYMTEKFINFQSSLTSSPKNVVELAKRAAARYDIIFRCSPVRCGPMYDPNRVHSFEQSVELDKRIDYVLDLANVDRSKVVTLSGNTKERVRDASFRVLELWSKRLAEKA